MYIHSISRYLLSRNSISATTDILNIEEDLYLLPGLIIDENDVIIYFYYNYRSVYLNRRIKEYKNLYQKIVCLVLRSNIDVKWNDTLNEYLIKKPVDYSEIEKIDYNSVLKNTLPELID